MKRRAWSRRELCSELTIEAKTPFSIDGNRGIRGLTELR
jgi:hypothetical protein